MSAAPGRPTQANAPSGLEPAAPKLLEQLWTGDRGEASRELRPARCSEDTSVPSVGAILRAQGLSRRWGGLLAVDRVSLDLRRGSVHAVIGTNGAGKSTLINMLSGELTPSAGSVELLGQDVTRWSQPRRARAGLGRSYQRNTIYSTSRWPAWAQRRPNACCCCWPS